MNMLHVYRHSALLGVICSSGPLILAPGLMGNFSLFSKDQREGMGLLEIQAMPFLRDVADDVWLCTFTI
jgi:hypothetical protein